MSGGAEANFPLGYAVNVDSHVNLLKASHAHAEQHFKSGPKPRYVFVSSLAVYGGPKARPESFVKPEYVTSTTTLPWKEEIANDSETPVLAETSYGCQKQIIELYVYDYGRKGFMETRSVRLPTVAIRPGAVSPRPLYSHIVELIGKPSSAASSFISGLIREPLQGQETVLPIADDLSDSIIDTLAFYVCRTKTVVRNIAYALCMDDEKLVKRGSRSINLPGIRITPRQILKAL